MAIAGVERGWGFGLGFHAPEGERVVAMAVAVGARGGGGGVEMEVGRGGYYPVGCSWTSVPLPIFQFSDALPLLHTSACLSHSLLQWTVVRYINIFYF